MNNMNSDDFDSYWDNVADDTLLLLRDGVESYLEIGYDEALEPASSSGSVTQPASSEADEDMGSGLPHVLEPLEATPEELRAKLAINALVALIGNQSENVKSLCALQALSREQFLNMARDYSVAADAQEDSELSQLLNNPVAADSQDKSVDSLLQQLLWMRQLLDAQFEEIKGLRMSILLNSIELRSLRSVQNLLVLQRAQLNVALMERKNQEAVCAELVPEDDGPGIPIFKGKVVEDTYKTTLIVGLRSESQLDISNATVTASLFVPQLAPAALTAGGASPGVAVGRVTDEATGGPYLENCEEKIEKDGVTRFSNLRPTVSTRMELCSFVFESTLPFARSSVRGSRRSATNGLSLRSTKPSDVISITNESQWCEAAGKLLLAYSFRDERAIPFALFANVLQELFMRATRVACGPDSEQRALNIGEMQYIHARWFESNAIVTVDAAARFWQWFGLVIQSLRFKRQVGKMWVQGMIYGFIAKSEATQLLESTRPGTFLVRLSESQGGAFAVGYTDGDPTEPVKHYLIGAAEISNKRNLADVLRDKAQFRNMLMLNVVSKSIEIVPKDTALKELYSKRQRDSSQTPHGYVMVL